MGSATRESRRAVITELGPRATATTGKELLSAARVIAENPKLKSMLAEGAEEASRKKVIVNRVFEKLGPATRKLLTSVASLRWSKADDLVAMIEELGIRVLASSTKDRVGEQLFAFGRVIGSDQELELALSSKLSPAAAKATLVNKLLAGKVSAHTLAILSHLVQSPRGRRVRQLIDEAITTVADASDGKVATVTVAKALTPKQQKELISSLAARYGARLSINQIVDPSVIGGVRISVGTDVIDGSIAARLNDLRLQLAG